MTSSSTGSQALVDTNILVYAYDRKSEFHAKAKAWLEREANKGTIVISWQNLLEFYSIMTSAKRTLSPLPASVASQILHKLSTTLFIIAQSSKTQEFFLKLMKKYKPAGPTIYDLYLATTALGNGIFTIYTINVKDFKAIVEIRAINPFKR